MKTRPKRGDRRSALATLFAAVGLLLGVTTTGTATEERWSDRVRLSEPPALVPGFTLTDQDGQPFTSKQLRGKAALVFFGFTNCPNVCPPTMQKLRQVQRSLTAEQLAIDCVLISVDGSRDTPEVMREYLEPFMPGFIGLTGDPRLVRDIAAGFSAVFFKGMPNDDSGGYLVEHSSQVYLLDREGLLRATFYNAAADEIEEVVRQLIRRTD